MDDKKIYALLLGSIKQDDKKAYFHFVSVKRTSRISELSISKSVDSYKVNYYRFKKVINDNRIGINQINQTLRQVKETIQLINCSTSFDLMYPLTITSAFGFIASLESFFVFFYSKETDYFKAFAYSTFGTISILITAFCVYRNSLKILREARLQRLKNYLEDFIEDCKQESNLSLKHDEVELEYLS